jgi:hypothetical protein
MPGSQLPYHPANLNEFKLFVFIMLANADNKMDLPEINHLFERLDEDTFSHNLPNNELLVARVYKAYRSMNEAARLDFVKDQLQHFYLSRSDQAGASRLLRHLHEIIMADGMKSPAEERLLVAIEAFIG